MTTIADESDSPHLIKEFRFPLPRFVRGLPSWARVGGILLLMVVVALWVRTRDVGQQYWMDEAISVGISSHSLSAIPGILRVDGSPPLYYLLLHIWMSMVGNGEAATHWLSEIFAALTIPVAYWGGSTIAGRRAGLMSATLFAFSAFIDYYSVETRMYTLMALLALLATIGFVNGFVLRRRRYVALFAIAQALMFYTHAWSIYFAAGSFLSLILLWRISGEDIRKDLIRDAVIAYGAAVVLFLPWVPNFIYQAIHTAAPWDVSPRFGFAIQIATAVIGAASLSAVFVISAGVGYSRSVSREARRTPEFKIPLMLLVIPALTLALAWIGSQITPNWDVRYFAVIVAPLLLFFAIGMSRAGVIGALAIIFTVLFMARPSAFIPSYKSDMQDIGGEMYGMLHKGDLVLIGQPESMPLAYYYLPGGLKWANTIGPVQHPTYFNWVDALKRYENSNPWKVLPKELAALKPGQQLLYIRPLTEGEINWNAPWTRMIQLRSAQYGEIIAADKQLKMEAWAPHNYRGSCCIADGAVLYKKV